MEKEIKITKKAARRGDDGYQSGISAHERRND